MHHSRGKIAGLYARRSLMDNGNVEKESAIVLQVGKGFDLADRLVISYLVILTASSEQT